MRALTLAKRVRISVLLMFIASTAHSAPCTNGTLHGSFGYQEQGSAVPTISEFRSVGVFTFNGDGTGSRVTTIWYSNFSVVPEAPSSMTYVVRPNCTFDFAYVSNGETFTGSIVQGGRKLLYMETSGNPIRSGQAESMRADN
jgi:hypothetical protein